MYLRIVTDALSPAERALAAEQLRQLADLIDPILPPNERQASPDREPACALAKPTKETRS